MIIGRSNDIIYQVKLAANDIVDVYLRNRDAFVITTDSSRTGISLELFDIESMKQGSKVPIWSAIFSTKQKYFSEAPEHIFDYILSYYGKSKQELGNFKPPPNRGKRPK